MNTYKIISTASMLPVREFESKEDLLYYLSYSSYVLSESGHNVNDSIISDRNTVWHDYYYYYYYSEVSDRIPIRYLIKDQYDRIMDIYSLAEDVYAFRAERERARAKQPRANYRYYYIKETGKFIFTYRQDPVPGIHKYKGRYYRKVKKGKQEYTALIIDKEILNYRAIAKKRQLLDSWGDDHPRGNSKSWKNKKYKKQYEKHIKV